MTDQTSDKFDEALKDFLRANERLLGLMTEQANTKYQRAAAKSKEHPHFFTSDKPSLSKQQEVPTLSSPRSLKRTASDGNHHYTRVYIAGARALKTLSDAYGLSIFKIGSTNLDLLGRLRQLNADGYASIRKVGDDVVVDDGFSDWRLMPLDYQVARGSSSAVWVEQRALRVRLPPSLPPDHFEALLRARLLQYSLTTFLRTEDGEAHFGAIGINPASALRYTPYAYGSSTRLSEAQELYIFRYHADLPRLCQMIDAIVSAYAGRSATRTS